MNCKSFSVFENGKCEEMLLIQLVGYLQTEYSIFSDASFSLCFISKIIIVFNLRAFIDPTVSNLLD